jgi:uncharacterized damage-inducible protein DinB
MSVADVFVDAFGRVRDSVHATVAGLTQDQLAYRVDPTANSIAWLVWHLARVQDDHLADATGQEQVWTVDGWHERYGLPFAASDIGYGHDADDVAELGGAPAKLLTDYYDAVHKQTIRYVADLKSADLSRIVDERWDPPVTLGVRLVSVVNDDLQHVGQAAFVRGVVLRR